MERYDDSEFYFKEVISLVEDIPNKNQSYEDKRNMVNSSNVLSDLYFKKNKHGQSRKFAEKALKFQKLVVKERI